MIGTKLGGKDILVRSQDDFVRLRTDLGDKNRIAERNAKPFSLTDRIMCDSLVSA